VEFDSLVAMALAHEADSGAAPSPLVKERLMARVTEPATPEGFSFRFAGEGDWLPHPVPGIRMKMLAHNPRTGYVMLLLDAAPGARFPAHHHAGAEECYVLSGSLYACKRRMTAGDFLDRRRRPGVACGTARGRNARHAAGTGQLTASRTAIRLHPQLAVRGGRLRRG
jgi:anti-sigma factor ChrR (cupin superfamily)